VLGITIEEYESLGHNWGRGEEYRYQVVGGEEFAGEYTAILTAEWVQARGAEVLAGYREWYLTPYAALTREGFYDRLIADILSRAGIAVPVTPPAGVEASIRASDVRELLFLINHTEELQTVQVPAGKVELLSGVETGETLTLDRYGVAVIQM